MQEHPGRFIALEGADGSGKGTQFKLLAERLRAVGYEVETFDFPRYDQPSSHFVKKYLNGDYGPANQINPYAASLFYALDRYEASADIRQALKTGKIVLSNRYAGSNMAHQGSKFSDETEQRGFFVWADSLEFNLLGIPRPDINLFLRVPAEISYELVAEKAKRNYTNQVRDQHEADIGHLRNSVATYDLLCQLFPKDFTAIECTEKDQLLSIPAINNRIWEAIQPLLTVKPPNRGHKVVVELEERPVQASEPAFSRPTDAKHLEIKLPKLSLLAASTLEAAAGVFVEVRPPWQFNAAGGHHYYCPPGLDDALKKKYDSSLRRIAGLHQHMSKSMLKHLQTSSIYAHSPKSTLEELAYNAIRPVIPLAATTSATVSGSELAIAKLVAELETTPLTELQLLASQIKPSTKHQQPSPREAKSQAISALLNEDDLPSNIPKAGEPLKLLDYWPRSEFSLLADGIYPYFDLGRDEISEGVDRWTYQRKEKALRAMALDPASHVLSQVKYNWGVVSDRLTISDAIRGGLVEGPQMQASTPRYGYEVPALIEQTWLENDFMQCFDISLELYSELQAAKKDHEAVYATLLGHKLRWQFSVDGERLANQLIAADDESSYSLFLRAIRDKITEVHPVLATALARLPESPGTEENPEESEPRKKPRRRSKKPRR